jgi:hypothetical protein
MFGATAFQGPVRLLAGILLACLFGAPVAHAATGRITVTGAVLAPTCAVSVQDVERTTPPAPGAVQNTCADAHRAQQTREVQAAPMPRGLVDPRVNVYFKAFAMQPHNTRLATVTYR